MPGRFKALHRISWLGVLAPLVLGAWTPAPARADTKAVAAPPPTAAAEMGAAHAHGDLLLFPAVTGHHRTLSVPGVRHDELSPEINVFYSAEGERLRFLAEFLWNRDEHEVERLQLGWLVRPTDTVWLGRFHSPLGFWNGQHHHGAFMQTTITRPGILNFEDDGGVLPTHITGVLAEGAHDRERGTLNYAVAIGLGPEIEGGELHPVNLGELRNGGDLALGARLSYRPFDERGGEFGGFAGYARIPVRRPMDGEGKQTVAGVFYDMRHDRLRLLAELFYVGARLEAAARKENVSFRGGYLQAEYQVNDDWTAFGRVETTSDTRNNPYLELNPEFLFERVLAGARFELGSHQALKVEVSHNRRIDDADYGQVSLQWSMVYP